MQAGLLFGYVSMVEGMVDRFRKELKVGDGSTPNLLGTENVAGIVGLRLIVCGHSHRPELEWIGRCLLLNPGACGQRRFHLPLTVALVHVLADRLVPEILGVE